MMMILLLFHLATTTTTARLLLFLRQGSSSCCCCCRGRHQLAARSENRGCCHILSEGVEGGEVQGRTDACS